MLTKEQLDKIIYTMLDEITDNSDILKAVGKAVNEIEYLLGKELTVNEKITLVHILKNIIDKNINQ